MKIVFIAARSLDHIGGIETYMKNLCMKLAERGHDIILYCEGNSMSKSERDGFKVIKFKSFENKFLNKIYLGFVSTIHSLIFNRNVDIYHFNAMASGISSWIPRLFLKNVIFQGHGFEWQRTKWTPFQRKVIKVMDDFTIFINKNITMVSDDQSDYVESKFNKKSITITPAINIPTPLNYNSTILKKYGLEPNKYILFLGRLVEEKNPDLLIKAFLKTNIKNLKLVIAGDDLRSKKYISYLHELALKNSKIIFTGAVYGDDKEVLLRDCFAFCLPSSLEGLPITLLEAMSYKKPCIASNIPACKEALDVFGYYFENGNEKDLIQVLESIEIKSFRDNTNNAFERVNDMFTWSYVASKYEKFCYEIILNNR